jgi:hypothetical protein
VLVNYFFGALAVAKASLIKVENIESVFCQVFEKIAERVVFGEKSTNEKYYSFEISLRWVLLILDQDFTFSFAFDCKLEGIAHREGILVHCFVLIKIGYLSLV